MQHALLPLQIENWYDGYRNLLDGKELRFMFGGGIGGVSETPASSTVASQLAFNHRVLHT